MGAAEQTAARVVGARVALSHNDTEHISLRDRMLILQTVGQLPGSTKRLMLVVQLSICSLYGSNMASTWASQLHTEATKGVLAALTLIDVMGSGIIDQALVVIVVASIKTGTPQVAIFLCELCELCEMKLGPRRVPDHCGRYRQQEKNAVMDFDAVRQSFS